MLFVLLLISTAAVLSQAHHDFYGGDSPRFYNPQVYNRQSEIPPSTVNIFKIYAPKQIFVGDYNYKKDLQSVVPDFVSKDKQMIRSPVSIIDRILAAEDFIPNEIMDDDESYYFNQFDESFEPQASSIVSRKLPPFHEPSYDVNHDDRFSRGMDSGLYSENHIVGPPSRGVSFHPNLHMDHDEYCDHENGLVNNFRMPAPINKFNEYHVQLPMMNKFNDFPAEFPMMNKFNEFPAEMPIINKFNEYAADMPMMNKFNDFSAELPMMNKFNEYHTDMPIEYPSAAYIDTTMFNTHFEPTTMTLSRISPLMSFFKTISSGSEPEPEKYDNEVRTTVTYGEPEIINETNANEPQQLEIEEFIPIKAVIETIEANTYDSSITPEDDVVEINRSFVKTILPDNTSVTREVPNSSEEAADSVEDDAMEEIEVNVIKTILPDNTFTVSEVITEQKHTKDTS